LRAVRLYIFLPVARHLAGALVLKRRQSHIKQLEVPPANIPYVLIGTGLLWFGWFGFNAGSAGAANALSVSAFATTNTAAAAAGLSWMFFDVLRGKKPSVLGFCIGAVVGLVAITPAAGFVAIPQSIFHRGDRSDRFQPRFLL
jgi:Amt family ammonium transporter